MKQEHLLINRSVLKSKIVLNSLTYIDMCSLLHITENTYYSKLNGKKGFTEEEIFILVRYFGKSIFFNFSCNEKRRKEGRNDG